VSWSYRARIWDQSVSAAVGASECTAAIAAWIWYGPGRLRRRQARTMACPSATSSRFHKDRSWSGSSTIEPSAAVRAGRRDSVSSSSASSPATSGSSGISPASSRVSRIASAHRSARTSSVPLLAAYPSLKIR
jgi:hypothetical protein